MEFVLSEKEVNSVIDEVVKLKFGKDFAIDDPKKQGEIIDFFDRLRDELNEEEKDHNEHQLDREMIAAIENDDTQEGFIPFVVIRKEKTTIDIKCPHCLNEDKLFLSNFKKSQFKDYECPNCHKKILVKLDFTPNTKIYIEQE